MAAPDYELLIRSVHIFSLVFCLLLAVFADLRASRILFRPLLEEDLLTLKRYHVALSFALVALWITGLSLTGILTEFNAANVSPKLATKFIVVGVLTLNAVLIGRIGLPMMGRVSGNRLGDLPLRKRIPLCIMSSISFVSWISAASLGGITALKTASADVLLFLFGNAYLLACLGGFVLAAFAGLVAFLTSPKPKALIEDFSSIPSRT